MTGLVTILLLLEPALAAGLQKPAERHCYFIRVFPIPKDFSDSIAIPMAKTLPKLEEVRPNCWAAPSANLLKAAPVGPREQSEGEVKGKP